MSKFKEYLEAVKKDSESKNPYSALKSLNKKEPKFTLTEWKKLKKEFQKGKSMKAENLFLKFFPYGKDKYDSLSNEDIIIWSRGLVDE